MMIYGYLMIFMGIQQRHGKSVGVEQSREVERN
jgi:hypothetical protein